MVTQWLRSVRVQQQQHRKAEDDKVSQPSYCEGRGKKDYQFEIQQSNKRSWVFLQLYRVIAGTRTDARRARVS